MRDHAVSSDASHANIADEQHFGVNATTAHQAAGRLVIDREVHHPAELTEAQIEAMSLPQRLETAAYLGLPSLAKDVVRQLVILVGTLALVWTVSHFVGVGEVLDTAIASFMFELSRVAAAAAAIAELYRFFNTAKHARSEDDLRIAGRHFANGVDSLGALTLLTGLKRLQDVKNVRQLVKLLRGLNLPRANVAEIARVMGNVSELTRSLGISPLLGSIARVDGFDTEEESHGHR